MKKFITGMIAAVLLFTAGVFLGPRLTGSDHSSRDHSSGAVQTIAFDDIAELATERMDVQGIYEFTQDKQKLLGIEIPLTGKKILITYDGTAKAGIKNASEITIEKTDNHNKNVTVKLPEVQILDLYTENDKIYDVNDSVFNAFKIEDYPELKKNIKEEFQNKVNDSDLLNRAEKSVETFITDRVRSYYGQDYTVKFDWQKQKEE